MMSITPHQTTSIYFGDLYDDGDDDRPNVDKYAISID